MVLGSKPENEKLRGLEELQTIIVSNYVDLPTDKLAAVIAKVWSPQLVLSSESQSIWKLAIGLAEEVCRLPKPTPALIIPAWEGLLHSLGSGNVSELVKRWGLVACARSWRFSLWVLANSTKIEADSKKLKELMWKVKANASELLSFPLEVATKIDVVKLCEVVSMTLLLPVSESSHKRDVTITTAKAPMFESLRDAPHFHPSLPSAIDLAAEGMENLKSLSNLTKRQDQQPKVLVAAINSLTIIARSRANASELVIDSLCTLSSTQNIIIQQTLKSNSIVLLKAVAKDENSLDNPLLPKLVQILKSMKAEEHLVRHLTPLEKRKAAQDAEAERVRQALKDWPPGANRFPSEGLHLLPSDTLARLLVDNAGNIPERPPPGHRFRPPKLLLGKAGIPLGLERMMAQIRAVETGRGGLNLPKPLQDVHAQNITPEQASKQRDSAFGRVLSAAFEAHVAGSRSGGSGWGAKSFETCGIISARLACDYDINSEDKPHVELRQQLISNFLVKDRGSGAASHHQTSGDDEIAAVAALHIEFAADQLVKNESPLNPQQANHSKGQRYEEFTKALISHLTSESEMAAIRYKRVSRILTQAPALPRSVLRIILQLCENPKCSKEYILVLRDVILARPAARDIPLKFVLLHATRVKPIRSLTGNYDSRNASFNLIGTKLFKQLGEKWTRYILDFAQSIFASVTLDLQSVSPKLDEVRSTVDEVLGRVSEEDSEMNTGTEDDAANKLDERNEVLSRIQLFVALCAADASLIPTLIKMYADLRSRLSHAESQAAAGAVSETDEEKVEQEANTKRVKLILELIHLESDKLWLKTANTLSQPSKTIPLLQDFPLGSEDLVVRAVDQFSLKDPNKALDLVVNLKAEGEENPVYERDARFIVPVIGSLERDEVFPAITRIAEQLPAPDVKQAVKNVVRGSLGQVLDTGELLINLVNLPTPSTEALMNATDAGLEFVDENTMRKCFMEMVEQETLPKVLMRILIRGWKAYPILKKECLFVLNRLVQREVWTNDLWKGFQVLAMYLKPESFDIILRLPDEVFESFVLENEVKTKNLRDLLKNVALELESAQQPKSEEAGEEGLENSAVVEPQELTARVKSFLGLG